MHGILFWAHNCLISQKLRKASIASDVSLSMSIIHIKDILCNNETRCQSLITSTHKKKLCRILSALWYSHLRSKESAIGGFPCFELKSESYIQHSLIIIGFALVDTKYRTLSTRDFKAQQLVTATTTPKHGKLLVDSDWIDAVVRTLYQYTKQSVSIIN